VEEERELRLRGGGRGEEGAANMKGVKEGEWGGEVFRVSMSASGLASVSATAQQRRNKSIE